MMIGLLAQITSPVLMKYSQPLKVPTHGLLKKISLLWFLSSVQEGEIDRIKDLARPNGSAYVLDQLHVYNRALMASRLWFTGCRG